MKAIKRNFILFLLIAAPLVCLTIMAVRFYGEAAREQRNRALVEAVRENSPEKVLPLLARDADPNSREKSGGNVPFWRLFWDRLRGYSPPSVTEDRAALTLAVQRNMTAEGEEAEENFAIMRALHDAGANATADTPALRETWNHYARELNDRRDAPLRYGEGRQMDDPQTDITNNGMTAPGYAALARCRRLAQNVTGARNAFRIAALWRPNDAEIQRESREAEALYRAQEAIAAQVPAGQALTAIHAFPAGPGRILYAVLYGKAGMRYADNLAAPGYADCDAMRCAIYEQEGGAYRRVTETPVLHDDDFHREPRFETAFTRVDLYALKMTGRPAPEIVIHEQADGGSRTPAHMDIFEWRHNRLRNILDLSSGDPLWLEDLRRDGRYEVRNAYELMGEMCHAEMPRRSDIYAWNGREFALADPQFPDQYRAFVRELEAVPDKYSGGGELENNLAYFYTVTGQTKKAEALRRELEQKIRNEIAKAATAAERKRLRRSLYEVRHCPAVCTYD